MSNNIAQQEVKKKVYPIFLPLGKVLAYLKIHPVVFTLSGLIMSFVAFLFFVSGSLIGACISIFLIELNDILDGQLARYAKKESRFGAFIDSTVDRYAEGFIYLGLLAYFWQDSFLISLFILAAFTGSMLVSYTRARAEGEGFVCRLGLMKRKVRMVALFAATLIAAVLPDGRMFLAVTIVLMAVLCHFTALQRILLVRSQV